MGLLLCLAFEKPGTVQQIQYHSLCVAKMSRWGHTSYSDGFGQPHHGQVVVVAGCVVLSVQYDPVYIWASQGAHVCPPRHHLPATQLFLTTVGPGEGWGTGVNSRTSVSRCLSIVYDCLLYGSFHIGRSELNRLCLVKLAVDIQSGYAHILGCMWFYIFVI